MSAWVVFSNNEKIGSKAISYGSIKSGSFDDIPSHMSFVFFNTFVYESRLESGVVINEWDEFKLNNRIVKAYDLGLNPKMSGRLYCALFNKSYRKKYDWKAVLYLGYRQAMWKFFGWKKPDQNPWNTEDRYYCNELYSFIKSGDLSMITPYDLMLMLENKYKEVK